MDPGKVAAYLEGWIRDRVRESGARGIVVGLSGGVDSAVVAALSSRAFIAPRTSLPVLSTASYLKSPISLPRKHPESRGSHGPPLA